MNRRSFLRQSVTGAAALSGSLGFAILFDRKAYASPNPGSVALIKGNSRYDNMCAALETIGDELKKKIGEKQVVIKPNLISFDEILASTNTDHLKAILDFLKPFYSRKVIIAESSPRGEALTGFQNLGYRSLDNGYNIDWVDLNTVEPYPIFILDSNGHPLRITIPRLLVDANTFLISAARLKVHNAVVVTLSNKNIMMGAPQIIGENHYKRAMHQGMKEINYNLFRMSQAVPIHLATIDGFDGMEKKGPRGGEPVDSRLAIASTDFVAADRVGIECMGVNFEDVGYLTYCAQAGLGEGNLTKINIIGEKIASCRKKYQLNENINEQLQWKS